MALRIAIDVRHSRDYGFGTYIRNLIRALAGIDSENLYLLVGRPQDTAELGELPANFQHHDYSHLDTELSDHFSFPAFLRRLKAHLFHIPLNAVPYLMPKPYVVTVHDLSSLVFTEGGGAREAFRLHRFRRGLMRAERVIAVSEATRRDLERLLGVSGRHIRQIYSSIDPSFLNVAPHRDEERRRVLERYQIHYPFVLYAGSVRPQKNVPRLIEAFSVLRSDLEQHAFFRDMRLIIVGSDLTKNPEVRRAVIQSRVEQFVRFLGYVPIETLRVFYETASVFAFPSLYEGFGLPPLEAMASGTPVVTSGVSSLPEVVGDAAEIVNPENVFDIARGMREVLLDSKLRMQLIALGRERLKAFDWTRTAAEVLDTYREVAGTNVPAQPSQAGR